jgi:uncharacterized membrane-anchored protein
MPSSIDVMSTTVKKLIDNAIAKNLNVLAYLELLINTADEYASVQQDRRRDTDRVLAEMARLNAEIDRITAEYNALRGGTA